MSNYKDNIQSKNFIKPSKLAGKNVMEKYTTEPAKVHLNSNMETIRNQS